MTFAKENVVNCKKSNNSKYHKVRNGLAPGYVAPDGGWGWMVVIATGFANVFCLPLLVCFGLIFQNGFRQLGISAFQTTTILNVNFAISALVGLANGPLFRKYSYRQATCVGGFICAISICALSFVKTFYGILILFSIVYAASKSVVMSSCTLAVVTYFKKKRGSAVGLAWACSGIGSIVNPQIATLLISIYGMSGTVLVFGGIAFNTVACGLVLQPVAMHAKRNTEYENPNNIIKEHDEDPSSAIINKTEIMSPMENIRRREKVINLTEEHSSRHFGSQYLFIGDEKNDPTGEDVIALEVSMQKDEISDWKRNDINLAEQNVITKPSEYIRDDTYPKHNDCEGLNDNNENTEFMPEKYTKKSNKLLWCTETFRELAVIFDLDLLRDHVYINLMLGVNFTLFTEMNFILLTPYILSDYGLRDIEIATVMSILGGVDVLTRIVLSFTTSIIGWDNRTFFLIGIGASAVGRTVLAHLSSYGVIMAISVLLGVGKALIIVFSTLVVADHVPLEKLPGACGLQHVTNGIIFSALGPVLGWFKDTWGSYTITLYFFNVFAFLVIIFWSLESWCSSLKQRRLERSEVLRD